MKIDVVAKLLADAVGLAREVSVSRRASSMAALETLLLSASDDVLSITASNMDQYLTIRIPCACLEPGSFCVGTRYMQSAMHSLSRDGSDITISIDGTRARFESDSSEAVTPYLHPSEFPALPAGGEVEFWSGEAGTMADDLAWAASCLDTTRLGSIYQGVHVVGGVGVVATDSRVGVMIRCFLDSPDCAFAIPASALPILCRVAKEQSVWTLGKNQQGEFTMLHVTSPIGSLSTLLVSLESQDVPRRLASQFVSHSTLSGGEFVWEFDSEHLRDAIHSVGSFDHAERMKISGKGECAVLSLESHEHKFSTRINGVTPEDERFVNPVVLKRALDATKADSIILHSLGDKWIISSETRTACMMGLRGDM